MELWDHLGQEGISSTVFPPPRDDRGTGSVAMNFRLLWILRTAGYPSQPQHLDPESSSLGHTMKGPELSPLT